MVFHVSILGDISSNIDVTNLAFDLSSVDGGGERELQCFRFWPCVSFNSSSTEEVRKATSGAICKGIRYA